MKSGRLRVTRKIGQVTSLTLPDGRLIGINIDEISGSHVILGITAPVDIRIERDNIKSNQPKDRTSTYVT